MLINCCIKMTIMVNKSFVNNQRQSVSIFTKFLTNYQCGNLLMALIAINLFNCQLIAAREMNRCSLAKSLYTRYKVSKSIIPSLLCLVEHSSKFDIFKITETREGRKYGIFQVRESNQWEQLTFTFTFSIQINCSFFSLNWTSLRLEIIVVIMVNKLTILSVEYLAAKWSMTSWPTMSVVGVKFTLNMVSHIGLNGSTIVGEST